MSRNTAGRGTPPESPEALAADIERTRHELGKTVEALAAKADVKARARDHAAAVNRDLRGRARTAVARARTGVRATAGRAHDARERASAHAPALQAPGARAYGAAFAVTGTLILAWLTVRRRRR